MSELFQRQPSELEFFRRHPFLYIVGGTFLMVFLMAVIDLMIAFSVVGGGHAL